MLDIANLSDIGEVMTSKNMMRIGAFLAGTGSNMASWRHPNAVADGAISLEYYRDLTHRAEEALLDFVFFGDGLYISEKSHPNFLNRFEPLTLLAALSMETFKHIEIATGTSIADTSWLIGSRQRICFKTCGRNLHRTSINRRC